MAGMIDVGCAGQWHPVAVGIKVGGKVIILFIERGSLDWHLDVLQKINDNNSRLQEEVISLPSVVPESASRNRTT